jgi:homoserine dehydrogenase
MDNVVNVGLLGAGTVGGGVILVLEKNAADIEKKVGMPVRSPRFLKEILNWLSNLGKNIKLQIKSKIYWKIRTLISFVELIGREHPAKEFIAEALRHGKNVVTANKDVLAKAWQRVVRTCLSKSG